jgi:hypothetical protein
MPLFWWFDYHYILSLYYNHFTWLCSFLWTVFLICLHFIIDLFYILDSSLQDPLKLNEWMNEWWWKIQLEKYVVRSVICTVIAEPIVMNLQVQEVQEKRVYSVFKYCNYLHYLYDLGAYAPYIEPLAPESALHRCILAELVQTGQLQNNHTWIPGELLSRVLWTVCSAHGKTVCTKENHISAL